MSNNRIITGKETKEDHVVPPGSRVTTRFMTEEHRLAYVSAVRMFQQGKTTAQEFADARHRANEMFGVTDAYNKAVAKYGTQADTIFDSGKFDLEESSKSGKVVITGPYQ